LRLEKAVEIVAALWATCQHLAAGTPHQNTCCSHTVASFYKRKILVLTRFLNGT